MSVLLIASSFVTTLLIPHAAFEEGGEANGRALAYLAHELPRRRLRHGLRRQHDPDPLVRRRLGDGRAAQHRAALPAALRHGARLGAGDPAAGAGLHRDLLRRDDPLPGRRRRPGRRLRHRRAGADDLGHGRGHALAPGGSGSARATVVLRRRRAGLRLHDRGQRSSSGPEGLQIALIFIVAIVVTSLVSRVLRSTELRVDARSTLDDAAERFIDEAARQRRDPHHRQPPGRARRRASTCSRSARSARRATSRPATRCSSSR